MSDVCDLGSAMRHSSRRRERDIARLADRQHGVIAQSQLLALGFDKHAIYRRVVAGRLHRLHVGVYAVGHTRTSRHGRWLAAVLACGPTATLSHRDAAALWDLLSWDSPTVHVTTGHRCRRRPGIAVHCSQLVAEDHAEADGIPVTSVARTLLDLAEFVPARLLERALEQAERLELFDLGAIERLIARSHGRHGLRALATALDAYRDPPPLTRSELERRFLDLCAKAGLPLPSLNACIAGIEVDAVWHEERLIVELDGHNYHRTRLAFERDRQRDATLQIAGYRVVRFTYRRLVNEPGAVIETIRSLLDAAG
jgi:hypothetical protein